MEKKHVPNHQPGMMLSPGKCDPLSSSLEVTPGKFLIVPIKGIPVFNLQGPYQTNSAKQLQGPHQFWSLTQLFHEFNFGRLQLLERVEVPRRNFRCDAACKWKCSDVGDMHSIKSHVSE